MLFTFLKLVLEFYLKTFKKIRQFLEVEFSLYDNYPQFFGFIIGFYFSIFYLRYCFDPL